MLKIKHSKEDFLPLSIIHVFDIKVFKSGSGVDTASQQQGLDFIL